MKFIGLVSFLSLYFVNYGCATINDENLASLPTVESVDLEKYMGLWYEIARLPNSFQANCGATTAEYQLNSRKNSVRVINRCEDSTTQEVQTARGTALSSDATNSKLRVSFVPLLQRWGWFAGDYWIIKLAADYSYSVVGHPQRKFLWILSRNSQLDNDALAEILQFIESVGYDPRDLIFSPGR